MNTTLMIASVAVAAVCGFALLLALVESVRDRIAVKRGERPCGECFACRLTSSMLFSGRELKRFVEVNHLKVCKYMEREFNGYAPDDDNGGIGLTD